MGSSDSKPYLKCKDIKIRSSCCNTSNNSKNETNQSMSSVCTNASAKRIREVVAKAAQEGLDEMAKARDPMKIVEQRLPKGKIEKDFEKPAAAALAPLHQLTTRQRRMMDTDILSPCETSWVVDTNYDPHSCPPTQSAPGTPPWEPTPKEREAAVTMACFGCTEIIYELCNDCRTDPKLKGAYDEFHLPPPDEDEELDECDSPRISYIKKRLQETEELEFKCE